MNTYNQVINHQEVNELYMIYLPLAKQSSVGHVPSLDEIVCNVIEGERRGYPVLDCVISVLKAMIYTLATPLEDQIRRAEEFDAERYANMTDEQKETLNKYQIPMKKYW